MQKERICCTSTYFHQGETLPSSCLSQCDVTWVLRCQALRRQGLLTCSEPCSWPSNPQGTRFSQWGPWTWWTSPSGSPTTVKQSTPVILLYRKWLEGPRSLWVVQTFSFISFGGAEREGGKAFHYVNAMKPIEVDFQMKSYNWLPGDCFTDISGTWIWNVKTLSK